MKKRRTLKQKRRTQARRRPRTIPHYSADMVSLMTGYFSGGDSLKELANSLGSAEEKSANAGIYSGISADADKEKGS